MSDELDIVQGEGTQSPASKRARNSQPPYLELGPAIVLAQQIYEQAGGTAEAAILSKLAGNSPSSSSFSRKLQALRMYKLTTTMVPPVSVSDVGLGVVAPRDEAQRLASLRVAALAPDPFRIAYERYVGKLLPQDEYLVNAFQHDLQVPRPVAQSWFGSFKSALEAAHLLYRRPDGKTQVMENAAPEAGSQAQVPEEQPTALAGPATVELPSARRSNRDHASDDDTNGHNTRILLSEGRFATIYIPDRITARDAKRLKGALTGIMSIIESMVDDPETLG